MSKIESYGTCPQRGEEGGSCKTPQTLKLTTMATENINKYFPTLKNPKPQSCERVEQGRMFTERFGLQEGLEKAFVQMGHNAN